MSDTRDTLQTTGTTYPATTSPTGNTSMTGTPSGGDVVDTAKQEAAGVADTAKHEAKEVGREARTQLTSLYHQTAGEMKDQAAQRQQRLAEGLQSAGSELRGMADSGTQQGVATDVVRQVSHRLDRAGSWLGSRDPGELVEEVKRYARRRPVVFLAAAALTGIVVGRLTRSLAAGSPDSNGSRGAYGDGNGRALGGTGAYGGGQVYGTGAAYAGDQYGATPNGALPNGATDESPTPIYDATAVREGSPDAWEVSEHDRPDAL